jgi:arylsulfatase A-like enzyme
MRNDDPLLLPTFMNVLHDAGYMTGLVGKYLNAWDGTPRPEYDYWVCQDGTSEQNATYRNPLLNVNGVWTQHEGYVTYIERDYALQFLNTAVRKKKPFFLVLGTRAPHGPAFPAPGHENLYSDLAPYRPPNYNEEDVSDKPAWVRRQELLTPEAQQAIDEFRRAQLRTLWSLDQSIRAMLNYLKLVNQMDNTIIIFTSDHGFYWGEHRLDGKNQVYEEDIRVPLAVRYPPAFTPGTVDHHLVANIDIAPTILQLAGLPVPPTMDGKPLTQLNSGNWRNDLLIQGWPLSREFAAVHTGRFVYCETYSGSGGEFIELYDLDVDPYQLVNVRRERPYRDIVDQLNQRLDELLSQ